MKEEIYESKGFAKWWAKEAKEVFIQQLEESLKIKPKKKIIKAWAIIGEKGFSHIAFNYKDAITWEGCNIIPCEIHYNLTKKKR